MNSKTILKSEIENDRKEAQHFMTISNYYEETFKMLHILFRLQALVSGIGKSKITRRSSTRFTVTCNLNSEMALKLEIENDHKEAQHFMTIFYFRLL